jgi:organic hydroperoxide reductase OsmC/OhrA
MLKVVTKFLIYKLECPKLGQTDDEYKSNAFAAGYAACFFDSALNLVIKQGNISVGETV